MDSLQQSYEDKILKQLLTIFPLYLSGSFI